MHSIRDLIDPGGRLLAGRLDQLCSTLESLSARLRGTIAQAIGESLGGFVRDAAWRVLNDLAQRLPDSVPPRLPASPNSWNTHNRHADDYWADDDDWEQDFDEPTEFDAIPDAPANPDRLATALARKTHRLLTREPLVVDKLQLNNDLLPPGGSRS